ncbi:MAG: ketoacyl-ACP synthase III [Chloroflexi bacterium]|nr:ketoacyl-ACP synthase III [Chloroflexota bacterium]
MKYARITGWGKYLPERVLSNADLEQMVETSDEWIVSRTGIRERRIAAPGETTSDMAVKAGQAALTRAGVDAADLDLIIMATSSPDHFLPPVSSIVQDRLGANRAGAFTLAAGCTGFVYGLSAAHQYIATGTCQKVLVIGAEIISFVTDWSDRNTCVLFGDGAGAVVLEAADQPTGPLAYDLGSEGASADALIVHGLGTAEPPSHRVLDDGRHYLRMNGRKVFLFATRVMVDSVQEVIRKSGLPWEDVELVIPHQANLRIIEMAARRLGMPMEKVLVNLDRYGNTSAASIPIALAEAADEGRLKDGDHVVLAGFGAGLTWASTVVHWQPVAPKAEPIAVSDWPMRERLTQPLNKARIALWNARVSARAAVEDAVMPLLLPLYTRTVRRRKKED